MNLSDLSISRPVLTWMMMFALATFGIMGFSRLGVDQYPRMDLPYAGVMVTLDGASPSTIEDEIVEPLEETLSTIEGVKSIQSIAAQGSAQVILEFELEIDIDIAAQDIRDKVNSARRFLPKDMDPPSIGKADVSDFPVIWAPIASTLPETEATEYIERHIKPVAESIPGVAAVMSFGARERNIRIWIEPDALRARNLAASDVLGAFRREHVDRPAGFVEGEAVEWALKTDAEFRSVSELENMIISWDGDAPIRLRDVARVVDGTEDIRDSTHMNGEKGVALALTKQSDGNTVAIVDEFKRRMDKLREIMPDTIEIVPAEGFIDFSKSIRESFEETMFALVFGGVLAVVVVFAFLRRSRPTFIVALAIPLSLITTFGIIWTLDFTLNTMTLLGLTLAIGVVIDDAIIVLENIERHREEGEPAMVAASVGTKEITLAAAAATFSVAAVFSPVVFATGQMGSFLSEFGITVAIAVIVSLFVALTLTPMLAARMPPPAPRKPGSIYERLEVGFRSMEDRYARILDWSLGNRLKTFGIAAASVAIAVFAGSRLPGEFFPSADSGMVGFEFRTPPGTSLQQTEAVMIQNEQWLLQQEEVAAVFARVGSTSMSVGGPTDGSMMAMLVDSEKRDRSADEIMQAARIALAKIPGQEISVMNPGAASDRDFEILLVGSTTLDELDHYSTLVMERLEASGGFVDMEKTLRLGLPEARVVPDREKAGSLGIDAATVAEVVQAMVGGIDISTFRDGEERHDIRMRMVESERDTLAAIGNLWVRSRDGELVDLRNVTRIEKGATAAEITRRDRVRSVGILANLDGVSLSDAVERAMAIGDELLPQHLSIRLDGSAESMKEAGEQFVLMLILAVLVIYMVLAAQFESLMHPLTVMLALPFSMVGALGGLWVMGMSLNLFSMIGIVLLIGLVTKNSILLVDYANQLRAGGMPKEEAMRRAAPVRMRPVLMTGLSMIFGVLPAALGIGPGAETRAPMAVATAAGMFTSMMLTLLVVPVFYLALDDLAEKTRALLSRGGDREPAAAVGEGAKSL